MSRSFLTNLNLNKNQLLNAAIQPLSQEPQNPTVGQIYFDTGLAHMRQWDGSQWLDYVTEESGAGYITDSDSTNFTVTGQKLYLNPHITLGGTAAEADGALTIQDASGNVTFESGTDGGPYTIVQGYFNVAYPTNGYSAFNVDSGAAVTTVRNVLSTTNDDGVSTVALDGNDQAIYFVNTSETQTGIIQSDSSNNLTINATVNNLNLNSNNGDIYLSPDGVIRPQSHVYQADGYNITSGNNIYSKRTYIGGSDYEFNGYLDIRNANGVQIFSVDAGAIADQGYNSYTVAGQVNVNAQINLNTEDGNPAGHLFTNQNGVIHLESNGDLALRAGANGNDGDIILYTGGTSGNAGKVFVGWNNDNGTYQQNEVATKGYVDSVAQGLSVVGSVITASDANIDLSQPLTEVGGWSLNDGERVLVKSQDDGTENGIYIYQADGGLLVRSTIIEDNNLLPGAYAFVVKGVYAAQGWILTQYIGQASTWTQFSAAGEYAAGTGISIAENTISARLGAGLTTDGSNNITFASGYGVQKYHNTNPSLTAVDGQVVWNVEHMLGTTNVQVAVYQGLNLVEVDVMVWNPYTVILSWVSGDVTAGDFSVVVIG